MDHVFLDTHAFHLSWQRDFVIIVAKFIFDPWKFSLEKKRGSSESLEAQMVEYLKEQVVLKPIRLIYFSSTQKIVSFFFSLMQIPSSFFSMLVAKINDIVSHMKEMDVSDASRDSQAPKRDYALELVQTICAVMGLDQNVEQDVRVNTPLLPFPLYLILILFDNHIV